MKEPVIFPNGERNRGKPQHRALLEKIAKRIAEKRGALVKTRAESRLHRGV